MANKAIELVQRSTQDTVPQLAVDLGDGTYALAVTVPAGGGSGSLTSFSTTIAEGESLSSSVNLGGGLTLVGISMPAAWTAAPLTFQASRYGSTFIDVYDAAGVELQVAAAANRYIVLDPALWVGVWYLKLRSGTSAAPVAQAAARSPILIVKAL